MTVSSTDQLYSNVLQIISNPQHFTHATVDVETLDKIQIAQFIDKTIEDITTYFENSLDVEEKFMLIYDYEDSETHLQQHNDFKTAFTNFKFEFASYGSSKLLALQLMQLIEGWQQSHLNVSDKQLCTFLSKRVWNDAMKTGLKSVDKEHTALFSVLNNLLTHISTVTDKAEILKTFKFFITYVDKHFRNEESMMKEFAYPDLENHTAVHKELTDTIYHLYDILKEEELNDSLKEDLKALSSSWLVDHVMNMDMKFAHFMDEL